MILVTGASGYLGQRLCQDWRGDALGVSRHRPAADIAWRQLDLADHDATLSLLDDLNPAAIVHCAAAQSGSTETELVQVNVAAGGVLATWCAKSGARLVSMSSDMVHGGDAGPYADDAEPSPISPYGLSKADGERSVTTAYPTAAIVRTSLIYGRDTIDRGTSDMVNRLAMGESLTLWRDVLRQPMEIGSLRDALALLVDTSDIAGVLNVAGSQALSRADFALAMLEYWDVVIDLERVSLISLGRQDSVPLDLRLDCDRAASLGISMPGVGAVCRLD